MKVALIQPLWNKSEDIDRRNDGWNDEALEHHLRRAPEDADLVVFPEGYPWSGDGHQETDECKTLNSMKDKMAVISKRTGRTFIAGGTVLEGEKRRNVVMLATPTPKSSDVSVYRKRLLWEDEKRFIAAGEIHEDALFVFGDNQEHAVIPLICADVFGAAARETDEQRADCQEVARRARNLMRSRPGAPIVVCAYAAGPRGRRWKERLTDLVAPLADDEARRFDVLFCNFAGIHRIGRHVFGRGGSRILSNRAVTGGSSAAPGACICDLGGDTPRQKFIRD